MKLTGKTTFEATPQQVWDVLLDPEVIEQCIPGCHGLVEEGPGRYSATLKLGLGPVSGSYEGFFQIHDPVAPASYTMTFEGRGRPGFVKGTSRTELRAEGEGTVVSYECEVEIGGLIASVGQRVLTGASSFLINQMFSSLRKQVVRRKSA